jgi:hypothetical protein
MENITLIFFTHSDYKYLKNILEDKLSIFSNLNTILCHDKLYTDIPVGFKKYIVYDDKLKYMSRWISILDEINTENILIIHDVDIVLHFDIKIFEIYFRLFLENNIDRLSLSIFKSINKISSYVDNNEYSICDLNNLEKTNHFVPYDVSPSLWKKSSFRKLCTMYPNETYASSEINQSLQNYCKKYMNCYGISYTNSICIQYCRGLVYSTYFKFLHITTRGKLLLPYDTYMDTKKELIKILEKYNIVLETQVSDVLKYFKPII